MADDTDQTTTPAPAAPRFTYPSPTAWKLTGDPGSKSLDLLVCFTVTIGLTVVHIRPGEYRMWGPVELLHKVVEWIEHFKPTGPLSFGVERPPERPSLRFELAPVRAPVRHAEIHGQHDVERLVARAIDAGLALKCIGLGHFRVTGQTRKHVAWLMSVFEVPEARALEVMNLSAEQAIAEDASAPMPEINVVLPTRRTTSDITRDPRSGDISQIIQLERSE